MMKNLVLFNYFKYVLQNIFKNGSIYYFKIDSVIND